tara:strand:- start:167 stop:694 length:528 start_codon:yes stop_codon:yes gene_type:complete
MNTIASLTRSNPAKAEEAVEDLADLMRANLNAQKHQTTIREELEAATIYQRIEQLRLGKRLRVKWDVDDLPLDALMPSLTIQPLLENAVYHGIELLPQGGDILITGSRSERKLSICISNPVAQNQSRRTGGNQMAMDNIRQRFDLAYGQLASVKINHTKDNYTVHIIFPYEEKSI